jgi:hypothetical protein
MNFVSVKSPLPKSPGFAFYAISALLAFSADAHLPYVNSAPRKRRALILQKMLVCAA